jgi:hypothetical protein
MKPKRAAWVMILCTTLLGCSSQSGYSIEGYMTEIKDNLILVVGAGKGERIEAIHFHLNRRTEIRDSERQKIYVSDLKIGQKVKAFTSSSLLPSSMPSDAIGTKVEMLPDDTIGSSPVSRNEAVEKALSHTSSLGSSRYPSRVAALKDESAWEIEIGSFHDPNVKAKVKVDATSGEIVNESDFRT